jgi:hypothetical protein
MPAWNDERIFRGMAAQLARRRELLNAGIEPLGWKLAFGSPAAMSRLRITAPLVGFLMRNALVPSALHTFHCRLDQTRRRAGTRRVFGRRPAC